MFCRNCGTKLEDTAAFCHMCATAVVSANVDKTPSQETAYTTVEQKAPVNQQVPQNAYVPPAVNGYTPMPPVYTMQQTQNPYYYNAVYSPNWNPEEYKKKKRRGSFAIAALILSLFGMIPCVFNIIPAILALVFSIIGIRSDRKARAITSLVFAVVGIIIALALIASVVEANSGSMPYYEEFFSGNELYF